MIQFFSTIKSPPRMSDFTPPANEELLIFKNKKRASALDWEKEFKHIITANPFNKLIMWYFNQFDNSGQIEPAVKEYVYDTIKNYLPKYLDFAFKYYEDKEYIYIKDNLPDFTLGVSHQIPDKEYKELIKLQVSLGCDYGITYHYLFA